MRYAAGVDVGSTQTKAVIVDSAGRLTGRSLIPTGANVIQAAHQSFQEALDNALVRERVLALLSAFFSIVAVVMVAVGVYGVLSYSVTQRTREIGIRLALGAGPRRAVGWLLADVGVTSAAGLVTGGVAGFVASRFITTLLYEVNPSDLSSIAAPIVALLVVCALAAVVPVLRATRTDPTMALRYE